MRGDRVHRSNRQAAWQAAGELRSAEDGGKRGRRGVGVDSGQLGCASDASRVDESLTGRTVVDRGAVYAHLELPRTLDEERPFLLKKRLERREVEHPRVRFDLAEVRVDRGVELQIRGDAVFEVAADGHVLGAPEGVVADLRHVLRDEIGCCFELARRLEILQAVDLAELRHKPRLRLPELGPAHPLGVTVQVAIHREAEGMAALPAVRQL